MLLLHVFKWFLTQKCQCHKSFISLSVFNRKRSGSIRTEKKKLRHQAIRFYLKLKKWQDNPADYLNRHKTHWKSMSKSERIIKRS